MRDDMSDYLIRALSVSGGIRVLTCTTASLAREISSLHRAAPTACIAMGRGVAGGALMGGLLKSGQRVALKFEGNGPLRKMIIEADSDGAVRASAANPEADVEPLEGRWNVAGVIGRAGFLTVSKDLGMGGEPYRGMIPLYSSEIGDDLAYYLTDSEQSPSAVGLSASLDETGRIAECGGFLIQALPGVDEDEREAIMARIACLPPLAAILRDTGPRGLLDLLFGSMAFIILETRELFFRCGCSRQKVERALLSLGPEALRDMRVKDQGADVTCEFCRQPYHFTAEQLDMLVD